MAPLHARYLYLAALPRRSCFVHSVVSWDFAMALCRLARDDLRSVLRRGRDLLGRRDVSRCSCRSGAVSPGRLITVHHFENLAKLASLTGMIVATLLRGVLHRWFGGHAAERARSGTGPFGPFGGRAGR